jgi:hypothetical protein
MTGYDLRRRSREALLEGCESEATRLHFVRTRPLPLPTAPLRSAVIQLTRNRLAAAHQRDGDGGGCG